MRPRRLVAPDGLQAGRPGSARHAVGQHGRARTRETAGALQKRGGSRRVRRPGGRIQLPSRAGRQSRPLYLRVTGGPRGLGGRRDSAPRSGLNADRAYDGDALRAWRVPQGWETLMPARSRRTNPSLTTRNGTRRATPWNGASAGSNAGGAWPRAMTCTRIVAWVSCTWRRLGSDWTQTSTQPGLYRRGRRGGVQLQQRLEFLAFQHFLFQQGFRQQLQFLQMGLQ